MKILISIIIVVNLIIHCAHINAGQYMYIAVPGISETLGSSTRKSTKVPTEKTSSKRSIVEAILMIDEMIKTYTAMQKMKRGILSRIFNKLNINIAWTIGDIILALKPEEQDIIMDVFRKKIQILMQQPGYEYNMEYHILSSVYKYVQNFSGRRVVVKSAGATAGMPGTPTLEALKALGVFISMHSGLITSALHLKSKGGRKIWQAGNPSLGIAQDMIIESLEIGYGKQYKDEPKMLELLNNMISAEDERILIEIDQTPDAPMTSIVRTDVLEISGRSILSECEYGMTQKKRDQIVREHIRSMYISNEYLVFITARDMLKNASLRSRRIGDEARADELMAQYHKALQILTTTSIGKKILDQRDNFRISLDRKDDIPQDIISEHKKKRENEKQSASFWDNLTYDQAVEEYQNADIYGIPFWQALVNRMGLEIEEQALKALRTSQ